MRPADRRGLRKTEAVMAKVIYGHLPSNKLLLEAGQACSPLRAIRSGSEPSGGGWKGTQAQRTSGCREKQVIWKGPGWVARG